MNGSGARGTDEGYGRGTQEEKAEWSKARGGNKKGKRVRGN